MNKWIGIGRLVKDPEVRFTGANNTAIARFTVACDRRFKKEGEQDADFISCVAFGNTAEFIEKYFFKGSKIVIEGHIQTGSYTNKDGQKVYTTDITVEQVEFGESKGSGQTTGSNFKGAGFSMSDDGFMNVAEGIEEELPFN